MLYRMPFSMRIAAGVGCLFGLLACGRISYDAVSDGLANADCLAEQGADTGIAIDALELEYATPNTLRVRWDSSHLSGTFSHYEVHLVPAVESPDCEVRRYDSQRNPGLGHYTAPQPAGYAIKSTTISSLDPDTAYLVQLLAFDDEGRSTVSSVLQARTAAAPTDGLVLFSEDDTAGYSIPSELQLAAGNAFSGSQYYEFVSDCSPGCFENLRRQAIDVPLASMSAEDFEGAYYEFALASSNGEHSYWSQARLSFEQADGSSRLFVYAPFVHRADDDYSVYQIPLSAFSADELSVPLRYDAASRAVHEFTVGGIWAQDQTVRIDELRIRW